METELELERGIVPAVTEWFRGNGRELPWREDPDPYRVWLSDLKLLFRKDVKDEFRKFRSL